MIVHIIAYTISGIALIIVLYNAVKLQRKLEKELNNYEAGIIDELSPLALQIYFATLLVDHWLETKNSKSKK